MNSKRFAALAAAVGVLGALALAGCQTTEQGSAQPAGTEATSGVQSASMESESPSSDGGQPASTSGDEVSVLTQPAPPVAGPRRTVAVGRFDAVGAFTSKYGSWDIGGGLAAMLTSALVESDRFIVVERAQLQQILTEQELKGQGVTSSNTGPDLGKLVGVQFLIVGSVTEFGTEDEGGGFSVGASGGGIGNLLSGALSRQSASGNVAMDFRVIDTTTGRVVETHRVSEPLESSGFDLSLGYQNINLGTNQFYKTPLGQAVRRAITRAVHLVARDANDTGWQGQVVEFDGGDVYINAGTDAGIREGDTFMVERVTKKLTDPTTNEVLMLRKKPLGIVEVQSARARIAFGPFQPLDVERPQRGDLVVVLRNK